MGKRRRRATLWLPAIYCMLALFAWIDFANRPPDGLANLGLLLVVLPYTAVDQILGSWLNAPGSVLMPAGYGYVGDHAIFFVCGVIFVASLLVLAGMLIDRVRQS